MKFAEKALYEAIQSIVSRCWLDVSGHGLPPAHTPVLAACRVGGKRAVYGAMVDWSGKWRFPEYQGDPGNITVLMWMPRPEIKMRLDTAFAFRPDVVDAILAPGANRGLAAAVQENEGLRSALKLVSDYAGRMEHDLAAANARTAELAAKLDAVRAIVVKDAGSRSSGNAAVDVEAQP